MVAGPSDPDRRAYSPQTLAEHWGVSSATVRNLIRRGDLKAFRIGRQLRVRPEWVETYERERESGGLGGG